MLKSKNSGRVFAFIAFAIVIGSSVYGFFASQSTEFIAIYPTLMIVALAVFALCAFKDRSEVHAVLCAVVLFFINMIVRAVAYVASNLVLFFQALSYKNMLDQLNYDLDMTSARAEEIDDNMDSLLEAIDKDTFGRVMDVVMIIFGILVIVISIMSIVKLIKTGKLEKGILSKVTSKIYPIEAPAETSAEVVEKEDKKESIETDAETDKDAPDIK